MKIADYLDTLTEVATGHITASDLVTVVGSGVECHAYLAGPANSQRIQILYLPIEGRAGVCGGAYSDWTDCDSARDALERYLGVDGKEMRE